MDTSDFMLSLSERIARIDERTKQIQDDLKGLPDLRERITAVEQRSKSNTHRLDGLYKEAVLLATVASIIVNILTPFAKAIFGG